MQFSKQREKQESKRKESGFMAECLLEISKVEKGIIVIKERRLFYFYIILFPFKWQLITFIAELGLTSYNSNFELLYKMRCVLPTSLKLTSVDSLI